MKKIFKEKWTQRLWKKRKIFREQGITLIALVITIIVLLILVGVTIIALTGDSGILSNANKASTETKKSSAKEKVDIAVQGGYTDKGIFEVEKFKEELEKAGGKVIKEDQTAVTVQMDEEKFVVDYNGKVKIKKDVEIGEESEETIKDNYTDKNNNTATIPKGFTVDKVLNVIDTGLVVKGPDGSEFVWVPVSDINTMAQCKSAGGKCNLKLVDGEVKCTTAEHSETSNYIVGKVYENGIGESFGTVNNTYNENSGIREPAIVSSYDNNTDQYNTIGMTLETLKAEYKSMINSVAKYNGFYIGRYETSLTTATDSSQGSGGTVQSKPNVEPVRANNVTTSMWYGLYNKQKEYTGKDNSVGSSMIWLSQYDAMLNWIKNSENGDKGKITDKRNRT